MEALTLQQHYRSSLWPRGQQNCTSPLKRGLQTLNMRKDETRAALEKTRLLMQAARDDRLFLFRAVFRLFENKAWMCGQRCFLNSNRSLNLFIVVFFPRGQGTIKTFICNEVLILYSIHYHVYLYMYMCVCIFSVKCNRE